MVTLYSLEEIPKMQAKGKTGQDLNMCKSCGRHLRMGHPFERRVHSLLLTMTKFAGNQSCFLPW